MQEAVQVQRWLPPLYGLTFSMYCTDTPYACVNWTYDCLCGMLSALITYVGQRPRCRQ
jgi:hypothetical protein